MKLTPNQILFCAELLNQAANEFSNHVCNDLEQTTLDLLSPAEKVEMARNYHKWNGDPEEEYFTYNDSAWMSYFAHVLREMAKENNA